MSTSLIYPPEIRWMIEYGQYVLPYVLVVLLQLPVLPVCWMFSSYIFKSAELTGGAING